MQTSFKKYKKYLSTDSIIVKKIVSKNYIYQQKKQHVKCRNQFFLYLFKKKCEYNTTGTFGDLMLTQILNLLLLGSLHAKVFCPKYKISFSQFDQFVKKRFKVTKKYKIIR